MLEPNLLLPFVERFEHLNLDYMVTGSVAGILYGEPRVTHDVDVVLAIAPIAARDIERAFPLEEFYCPPSDVIDTEIRRGQRGHFNLIHHKSGFKADVYIAFDALHQWGMARRQRIELGATAIWVAPPEYVILRKLQYFAEGGSEKHKKDIRSILEVSTDVDRDFVKMEANKLGVAAIWQQLDN